MQQIFFLLIIIIECTRTQYHIFFMIGKMSEMQFFNLNANVNCKRTICQKNRVISGIWLG